VAVKVLPAKALENEDAVKRFYREVEAAARLLHPNIVAAYDAGEHEGLHYLVMEYVDGVDLSELVKEQGPMSIKQAVDYIVQAARGLEYAHRLGVIHRDIKPGNLLLDADGTVKILDMGLARFEGGIGEKDLGEDLTSTGQIMGTCDYMAPEQAEDTHAADARADVYSLGCTLYRLIAGGVPYGGDTVMKKLLAHREAPIPSLLQSRPDVPEALQSVYERMMAKDPDDRIQTMTELIAELEAVLGRGVADSSATSSKPPEPELAAFLQDITAGKTAARQKTATTQKTEPVTEETIDRQPEQETDTSLQVRADNEPAAAAEKTTGQRAEKTAAGIARKKKLDAEALKRQRRMLMILAAGVALSLIGLIVLGVVMTIQTSYGTVVVATEDEKVQVAVSQGGELVEIIDAKDQWRVELKTGDYTIELKEGGDKFQLDKQSITITRGEELRVRVTLQPVRPPAGAVATGANWVRVDEKPKETAAGNAIDVLKQIDLKRDVVVGDWTIEDGSLVSKHQETGPVLRLPVETGRAYRLALHVENTAGACRPLSVYLPLKNGGGRASFDAYGTEHLTGLDQVDGKTHYQNETRHAGTAFVRGQPATIVITVEPGHIRADWDGKPVIDWRGDESRLSLKYGFPERRESGVYLVLFNGGYCITKIDFTPL